MSSKRLKCSFEGYETSFKLGMIMLWVNNSISLNINQFVEGHQMAQQSDSYVKNNFPSFQTEKIYKFILPKIQAKKKEEEKKKFRS